MSREEYQIINAAHDIVGITAQILRNIDYCEKHGGTIGEGIAELYLNMMQTQITGTWEYLQAINRDIRQRREVKI